MTTNELTAVLNGVFHNHAEKSFGVNEAVAIIAAVIALGALFVAYLARQDSKKSADAAQRATDLLARQLDLEINERDRKIQKEVAESRPYLTWRGGHHAGDGLTIHAGGKGASHSARCEFINVAGGVIRHKQITHDVKGQTFRISEPSCKGGLRAAWCYFRNARARSIPNAFIRHE